MFFSNFTSKIKERIRKMMEPKDIINTLKSDTVVSSEMAKAITLWGQMYEGHAPWLHEPDKNDPVRITSLNIPSFIASEKARMATLEMKSIITAPEQPTEQQTTTEYTNNKQSSESNSNEPAQTERTDFLNTQYKKLIRVIRQQLEYGIAKGGLVIKPYIIMHNAKTNGANGGNEVVEGVKVNNNPVNAQIEFDFVQADDFYPLAFDATGKMLEAAFIQKKIDKDTVYSRVEYHKLDLASQTVTVMNTAYMSHNSQVRYQNGTDGLGRQIALTDVQEWADIAPSVTIDGVDRLMFAYFKMPEANTIDPYSPLGVSGYSRVVNLIKDADMQYSRLLWEFEGGELAVDVDRDALKTETDAYGNDVTKRPIAQQRLFRKVDLNAEDTYNVFSPALRDSSLLNGLNSILMRIEDCTGLSRGTLSEAASAEAKTATELKILKQRSFATNADIQQALEDTLRDVVYIMDVYCTLYDLVPASDYEISFEWDDSIIVDIESELSKRITLMQNGLASKVETRMWYFGETKSQAEAALAIIDEETRQTAELNAEFNGIESTAKQESDEDIPDGGNEE
jgi:A118 family predicted phage portal protein